MVKLEPDRIIKYLNSEIYYPKKGYISNCILPLEWIESFIPNNKKQNYINRLEEIQNNDATYDELITMFDSKNFATKSKVKIRGSKAEFTPLLSAKTRELSSENIRSSLSATRITQVKTISAQYKEGSQPIKRPKTGNRTESLSLTNLDPTISVRVKTASNIAIKNNYEKRGRKTSRKYKLIVHKPLSPYKS